MCIRDRPKHLDSNPQKLKLEDFTKEVLETKPRNSPVPEKWYERGGEISIDKDGVWIYTNKKGITVSYKNGFPDFSPTIILQLNLLKLNLLIL